MEESIKQTFDVGIEKLISLCNTCEHMPSGSVPKSNRQAQQKGPKVPFMYCRKMCFFPQTNFTNEGKPFYDVAECDGYEEIKTKQNG